MIEVAALLDAPQIGIDLNQINCRDRMGLYTAIEFAVLWRHLGVSKMLLERGADINKIGRGSGPLLEGSVLRGGRTLELGLRGSAEQGFGTRVDNTAEIIELFAALLDRGAKLTDNWLADLREYGQTGRLVAQGTYLFSGDSLT